ncbi:MAG: hypothetical protein ACYC1E_16430 [Propionibacteriaceae bacterium]
MPVPRDSGRRTGNLHRPMRYSRKLRRVFYLSVSAAMRTKDPTAITTLTRIHRCSSGGLNGEMLFWYGEWDLSKVPDSRKEGHFPDAAVPHRWPVVGLVEVVTEHSPPETSAQPDTSSMYPLHDSNLPQLSCPDTPGSLTR